jgi:hypothetical protein
MRMKLLILSIIVSAGFSVADDAVLFGNVIETDWILTPEGVTNAILTTALTVEADPVAYPVATNALALAGGALQASWAATGTVSRAEAAAMLESPSGMTWLGVSGGNTYIYEVVDSSNVYVVATSGDGYNGPPAGTAWTGAPEFYGENQQLVWGADTGSSYWLMSHESTGDPFSAQIFDVSTSEPKWVSENGTLPMELFPESVNGALGSLILDWLPQTNVYQVAKQDATMLLVSGHNADAEAHVELFAAYATTGAVAAVQAAVAGKADAETVVSGAVGTASAGNRYFWTTATNVVLSVNLTSGQVVNLAKLNNTATNSITAIGAVGWEWTGGEMTNTIPAGKSMTFGFLVDAATGKTNAYATGVSK